MNFPTRLGAALWLVSCGGNVGGSTHQASGGSPGVGGTTPIVGGGAFNASGGRASGGKTSDGGASTGGAQAAEGGIGGGGATGTLDEAVTDADRIAGRSFQLSPARCVRALPPDEEFTAELLEATDCTRWVFHFIKRGDSGLELLAYGDTLSRVPLVFEAGEWGFKDAPVGSEPALALDTEYVSESLVGELPSLLAATLAFRFTDRDGDGFADALRAVGEGVRRQNSDDSWDDFPVGFELLGLPDATAPQIPAISIAPSYSFPAFGANEPLADGSSATLLVAGQSYPLTPERQHGVIVRFRASVLLMPGSRATLHVVGADLAGNAIDAGGSVLVAPAPEPSSLDFEGYSPFQLLKEYEPYQSESGARASYGSLTPLEGQRSFLASLGTELLLRFKKPLDATQMKLTARPLALGQHRSARLSAMLPGSSVIESRNVSVGEFGSSAEGQPVDGATVAGPASELSFTLGVGEDVLLHIDAPGARGSGEFANGVWLDDVRFE
ncbi:MAG: hypothetical protein QM756_22645 [Polyangiaceae bacterium]